MKIFFVALMLFTSGVAHASVKLNVSLTNGYIFLPLKGAKATAGYLEIKNYSEKDVILTLKSVEGFKFVEAHETIEKNSKMTMQKVENFKIAAGANFDLKPGGNHIMLFEPTREFKDGDKVDAIFLANDQTVKLPFKMVSRDKKESASPNHTGH